MSNWWEAAPLASSAVASKPMGNWWEHAPLAGPHAAQPAASPVASPSAPLQEKTTPAMPDPTRNNARWISDRDAANMDILPNERTIALSHLLPKVQEIGNDAYSDQTGQFYPLTPEGRVQFQQMDEQAARVDAQKDTLPVLPTAFAPLRSAGQDLSALNARALNAAGVDSFFGEKLDPELLNNMALAGNETDAAANAVAGDSTAKRYVRGGIRSAAVSLIGQRLAGPAGAIGVQAGITGNQAYAEAKQAGLSDADAKSHALKMAAAEGGIATVFQWMGLGGMERGLAKESLKKPLKEAFKQFGIRTLKEELPEELLTQVAQTMIGDADKVNALAETNPDGSYWNAKDGFSPRVQAYVDVVGQTGVAMGMSESARYIMASPENTQAWIDKNPEQAKALAALENPSRGDLEKNGIFGARETTPEQRIALAKEVKGRLAAVEPVDDESEMQRRAMSMTEDEFVAARPKPSRDDPGMSFERIASSLPQEETGEYAGEPGGIQRAVKRLSKGTPGVGLPFSPEQAAKSQSDKVVFYDDNGDPVGALSIQLNDKGQPDLLSVAVKPEFQGKGIATKLFDEARKRYPNIDQASGAGGYTEEGARFAYRRFRKQAAGLPTAQVKEWGSGKTVSREAQDALGKYVSDNFYSDPKRASIRDDDTTYQQLKAAAEAEKRSNSAIEAQDSRIGGMVDRQQAKREIAAGKVDRENIKYAELHDVAPELRTRIQAEAQRLLGETKSEDTRKALEKIIQDAGSDVGAKVEAEKERIVSVLTGELDQRTINEKESQPPRPPDPVVQGLLMANEQRRNRMSLAIRNFADDKQDDWVDYAHQRAYEKLNAGQGFDFDAPAVQPSPEQIVAELGAMAEVMGVSDNTEQASEAPPAAEPAVAAQPQAQVPPPDQAAATPAPSPLSPKAEAILRKRYKDTSGHDLGQFVAPEAEHAEAVDFMAARRKKVQFFRSPSGTNANSFYDPETKTVYVNADKKGEALWYNVGHEYAHASGADQRLANLPAEVIDAAKLKYAEGASPAYLKSLQRNPQKWTREAVARYVGEVLAKPETRAQIRKENPTLWQKIVAGIKGLFLRNKMPPSVKRVIDELNDLPPEGYQKPVATPVAASPPSTPPNTPPTVAPGGNGRYDTYEGFANVARGTTAGEAQQAVAEGMGATERDQRPRNDRIQDASAEYAVDPEKVRAELDAALKSTQPLSDRQTDLLNIVKAEAATKALASNDPDDLAMVARLNVAYLKKRTEAGKSLQSGSEPQFQTPEGRGVLIAEAITDISADDMLALESAKAELRKLGGDPSLLLSDEGVMLADNPQTRTEQFKRWFGDSKVVDAEGKPLVVYHGTPGKFSKFAGRSRHSAQFPAEIGVSFFTSDKEMARGYAGGSQEPMDVYLGMENPYVHDANGGWWISANFKAITEARKGGHDGVVIKNVIDTSAGQSQRPIDVYITFEPNQIKSATGNNGEFDSENPNILLADVFDKETARKTAEEKAALKNALRDDKIARAAANVLRLERSIAQKQAAFRAKMEAKGILPATPQLMAALLADPQKALYALREMRAYKNLARGKSLPFLPGIGHKGMLDALYEASMANILSGIKTMTVNAAGTPLNYLGHLVPRAVEATANSVARVATGGKYGTTGAQWGEVRHLIQGMIQGLSQGFINAKDSIWNEQSMLDEQSGRFGSALEGHGKDYAIPGRLGWLIRTPGYGTNRYMDDLSRTTIAHMEARANAYRDGVENGLSGPALDQHVDALYNDKDSAAWQGDLRGAYEYANKMAFQETGGETRKKIVNALSGARRDIPGVRWFLRFIKFPVNAAVQTKEWTPFHFFHVVDRAASNMRAGREWSYGIKEDMAKAFVGTLILYSIMGALEDDEREGDFGITGSSHPDTTKRNSLRFGDHYVSYRAMEPFGSALALLADTGLSIKKHGFGANTATSTMVSVADTVANKPTMRGINDISAFSREVARSRTEGDPEIMNKAARKLAAQQSLSFMPRLITSFTEAAGEGTGYEQRKRTTAELFDLDISDIASQYDVWGNKKSDAAFGNPVGDFAYKLLSPAGITIQPQHPGDQLIGKWNATVTDPKERFKFTELSTEYRKNGKTVRMTPDQFQRYAELSGQIAAELYEVGNFDPENPTAGQVAALKKNFEVARDKAKELLHTEWNGGAKATASAAEVAETIRHAQIRGLREKVGGKFTFKLRPGETAPEFQDRLQAWKAERDGAADDLKRLFATSR